MLWYDFVIGFKLELYSTAGGGARLGGIYGLGAAACHRHITDFYLLLHSFVDGAVSEVKAFNLDFM